MRIAGMLMFAAAAVPAVIGSRADAAFTELSFTSSIEQLFGGQELVRYRMYANFTSDEDRVVAVSGGSVHSQQPFYQAGLGTWTEPFEFLFPFFPDLPFDTFVTIGQTALPQGLQGYVPTFIAEGSTFGAAEFQAGWYAPVDAPYTYGPSVLIAQLTVPGIFGLTNVDVEIALEWMDASGRSHQSCMSMGLDWKFTIPCEWPHRADFNHDCVVNGFDLAILLGLWGVNEQCAADPLPWDCPGDLTCGPSVDGADLAELLAEWGPVDDCQLGR